MPALLRAALWGFAAVLSFIALLISPTVQPAPATYHAQVPKTEPVAIQAAATSTATTTQEIATSTKKADTKSPQKAPVSQAPVAQPAPQQQPQLPASAPESFSQINVSALKAVVNVICTTAQGGILNPISASGVIIDPRGIVVTNAHVAQYLLLKDYPFENNVNCYLRTGSPAYPAYKVELMYLPPQWINENAAQITSSEPTGTGENDYAFLRITGAYNPQTQTLPASFPFIPPTYDDPSLSENVLVAGYPAGFLGGITIAKDLYSTSTVVPIAKLYTFDTGTIDLISLGGSIAAQKGVSGGAAVNQEGQLIGVEATASDATNTADRDLRAITIGHIDRSLTAQRGVGLAALLTADPALFAQAFQITVMPTLTRQLQNVLDN